MAALYYQASRFYRDEFYIFVAIFWLMNLAYLLFQIGEVKSPATEEYNFASFALLLALTSDLPLYIAGSTKPDKRANYKALIIPFCAIFLWIIIYRYLPDTKTRSHIHALLAIISATYVGARVFLASRARLSNSNLDNTDSPDLGDDSQVSSRLPRLLLSSTFLLLAVLQPTYVVKLSDRTKSLFVYILSVALALKMLNAYALIWMLREDYADIRAQAERHKERLQQERLERSELEEIGLLTASIEHELRTPLGVVKSILNEMSRKYQNVDGVETDVEALQTQRERLLNATKIITVLRAGHEVFSKRLTTVNLTDLVRKAVKDLKKELNVESILFKYDERFGKPLAIAHTQLLEQAVINILKNAVESINSSRRSGGEILITISKSNVFDDYMVMDFKDNGAGFQEENIEKLTQPDFSTKGNERANSGLGLFVCERIIKLHNGTLEFKVPPEGGALVSISIPQAITKKERKRRSDNRNNANASIAEEIETL